MTRVMRTRQIRIALPFALLVMVVAVATAGYILIERPNYSFLDALYMTLITISTVGHREVHPLSPAGQVWTMFVIVGGVVTAAIVLSLIGSMVVEGQIRRIFGRRQLENKIKSLSGHVIVCGAGRMGEHVARDLSADGRDVVVIDIDPERTAVMEENGLLYILGDAQSEEVLDAAGIGRAAELVSTLPSDAENLLVTLTAYQSNPKLRIISRALETANQVKLLKAGATRVVCPSVIGATRMVDIVVRPAVVDFFDVAHTGVELEMDQIEIDEASELAGKTLSEMDMPRRFGVYVVTVRRKDGEAVYQPASNLKLHAGDTIIVVGKKGASAALQELSA